MKNLTSLITSIFIFSLSLLSGSIFAHSGGSCDTSAIPFNCCRPDGHAPAGVMSDHVHLKGQWGFSYSLQSQTSVGNYQQAQAVSDQQVLQNYAMVPQSMQMNMHMFMVMYGISDQLTAMLTLPYQQNEMTMKMPINGMVMPGMPSGPATSYPNSMLTTTNGLGDIHLEFLYKLLDQGAKRLIGGLGLSLPTGSINEKGTTLLGENALLPYGMQLGSGSYALLPSLTYVVQNCQWSMGANSIANVQLGPNYLGYTSENQWVTSAWLGYRWFRSLSTSIRLEYLTQSGIQGFNSTTALLAANDPNSNTLNTGSNRLNAYVGLNLYKPQQPLRGMRLALEYGLPVYQSYNGIQQPVTGVIIAQLFYLF